MDTRQEAWSRSEDPKLLGTFCPAFQRVDDRKLWASHPTSESGRRKSGPAAGKLRDLPEQES